MPAWVKTLEGPVANRDERFSSQLKILESIDQGTPVSHTNHNLPGCMTKTFDYLSNIAREDFEFGYEWEGKHHQYKSDKPSKVVVSNNLFRSYSCLDYGCSKCCWYVGFWNVFSNHQMIQMIEKYGKEQSSGYQLLQVVQGQDGQMKGIRNFHVAPHINKVCGHLNRQTNSCTIHDMNPIHCAFPLIKVKRVKDITYITRETFGRNQTTINCPAEFKPMSQDGFDFTIQLLERLKAMADEMMIKNHMEEVIKECKFKWKQKSWEQTKLEEI